MAPRNHKPATPLFVHLEEAHKAGARWVACTACWKTRKADETWHFPCLPRGPISAHCP
jgi:hypothetical protein